MLLVCSAWEEEVKAIKASNLAEVSIKTLGIGYLEAALQLNKMLQDKPYSRIIFLGTAGAYSKELPIGEIVSVSQISLLNLGEVLGHSYIPKKYSSYKSSLHIHSATQPLTTNCLSSLEITKSSDFSKKIIEYYKLQTALVENMELYGVAKVATEHNIPWSAFLGITNYTNENAHQDWKANHEIVSENLGKTLLEIITTAYQ